jgi:hypothetical protein
MEKTDIMKVTFQENNLLIGKNHLSGVCDILEPLHCPLLAGKLVIFHGTSLNMELF